MADLKALVNAVIKGDRSASVKVTKTLLDEGIEAVKVLNEGLIQGRL